jgi:hypothetical protein
MELFCPKRWRHAIDFDPSIVESGGPFDLPV